MTIPTQKTGRHDMMRPADPAESAGREQRQGWGSERPSSDGRTPPPNAERRAIEQRVQAWGAANGSELRLTMIDDGKDIVDATLKGLVQSRQDQPVGFVLCSQPAAPDLVERGVRNAEAIRSMLGEKLGQAIVQPSDRGKIDGLSYVLLPWYQPLSSSRLRRVWQKFRLRRPVLDWLYEATATAAGRDVQPVGAIESFESVLMHLGRQSFLTSEQKTIVDRALRRIDRELWRPRYVFDHNDLWDGNILLTGSRSRRPGSRFPFVLIDWAGANPIGYGVYDLVRLARALGLSSRTLRTELIRHASALQCNPTDLYGHFLAACGRLHLHLENFPEERFVGMLDQCWRILSDALPELQDPPETPDRDGAPVH